MSKETKRYILIEDGCPSCDMITEEELEDYDNTELRDITEDEEAVDMAAIAGIKYVPACILDEDGYLQECPEDDDPLMDILPVVN